MPTPIRIRIAIWIWLIAALVAGRLEWLARLPGPAIPVLILGLTTGILLGYFKLTSLRAWIDSLDIRALVLLHVTRFVGFYFLVLYRRGELPYSFAVPGGWGDIIVATLALLVAVLPWTPSLRVRAVTIWNVIGFIDILLVVASAGRLLRQDPTQLRALTVLPLSLLPTFLVPLIIATHVLIFLRLRRSLPA